MCWMWLGSVFAIASVTKILFKILVNVQFLHFKMSMVFGLYFYSLQMFLCS